MSVWQHSRAGGIRRTGERVPLVALWLVSIGGELVREGRTSADVDMGGETFTCLPNGTITDNWGNVLETRHERAEFERAFMC